MTAITRPVLYTGDDISINGVTLNTITEDGCQWLITDLAGWWGLPDVNYAPDARPYSEDGNYTTLASYQSRSIVMSGYVVPLNTNSDGPPFSVAARRTLNQALTLVRRAAALSVNESSAQKTAAVQLVGTPLTRFTQLNDALEFNFQLRAADPRKYSLDETSITITLPDSTAGRTYNRKYLWSYQSSLEPSIIEVLNPGSTSTPLLMSIRGPVVNPTITNVDTGKFISLSTFVDNGEVVTVDTANRSVVSSTGRALKNSLTGDSTWFDLPPGLSRIQFSGTQPIPAVSELVEATNLYTNPSFESTTGTAAFRTNLATNPMGTAFVPSGGLGFANTRSGGSGATTTYALVTGAADGPLPGITTYARKTWTAAPTSMAASGDSGFDCTNPTVNLSVAGGVYTISAYVRSSRRRNINITVAWQNSSGATSTQFGGGVTLVPGQWSLVTDAFTAPSDVTSAKITIDSNSSAANGETNWQTGDTLDATALLVEQRGGITGDVVRTNLHKNPAYDGTAADPWNPSGSANVYTATRQTSFTGTTNPPGMFSPSWLKLTVFSASAGTMSIITAPSGTAATAVAGGTQYTASAYVISSKPAVTGGVTAVLTYYTSSGAQISSNSGPTVSITTASAWVRASVTATVPSNAATAQLRLDFVTAGTLAVGDYIGATGALIEATGVLNTYFDGFGNGPSSGPSYSPTGTQYEYFWAAGGAHGVSNMRAESFGAITPVFFSGSYTARGRINYATDPGATALGSSGDLGFFATRSAGNNGQTASYAIVNAPAPPAAGLVKAISKSWTGPNKTTTNAQTGIDLTSSTGFTGLAPGDYTISVWLRSTSAKSQVGFDVTCLNGASVISHSIMTDSALSQNTWTQVAGAFRVPENATAVKLAVDANSGAIWSQGDTLWATGLLVERVSAGGASVTATNLLTNPSTEATVGLVNIRTNRATDPLATTTISGSSTTAFGWFDRGYGSGGAGTTTLVTGVSDGPTSGVTSYRRKTWTTAPAASPTDVGFDHTNGYTGFVAGTVYTISAWVRSNHWSSGGAQIAVEWQDATGNIQTALGAVQAFVAGQWVRLSGAFTAPASGATKMHVYTYVTPPTTVAVGDVLDGTGLQCETQGGVGATQRTNYCLNPGFQRSTTGWGSWTRNTGTTLAGADSQTATGGPGGAVTGFRTYTVTAADASAQLAMGTAGTGTTYRMPVTPGQQVTLSLYARANVARSAFVAAEFWDASNVFISGPVGSTVAMTANTWTRLSVTQTAPAGAAFVSIKFYTAAGGSFAISDTVDVSQALWEFASSVGTYFDGLTLGTSTENAWTGTPFASTSVQRDNPFMVLNPLIAGTMQQTPDSDFSAVWDGTANASTTSLRGVSVIGTDNSATTGVGVSSAQWSSTGSRSLRGISTGSGVRWSTDQFVDLSSMAPLPSTLAGKTITVMWKMRLPAALTGTYQTPGKLRLSVNVSAGGSVELTPSYISLPTNTPGVQEMRCTVAIPANATTWSFLRCYIGSLPGNGDVWFDDLLMIEGTYADTYFDGSTVGDSSTSYRWTGSPNASTSVLQSGVTPLLGSFFSGSVTPPDGADATQASTWLGTANDSSSFTYDSDLTAAWTGTANASTSVLTIPVLSATSGTGWAARSWASTRSTSLKLYSLGWPGLQTQKCVLDFTPSAGKTYTVLATCRIAQEVTASATANERMINVMNGTTAVAQSSQAPAAPGVYDLSLTWACVSSAERIVFTNGFPLGVPSLFWDNICVVEGVYTGSYFDGSILPSSWTGAADASTSYQPPRVEVPKAVVELTYRTAWIE